MWSQPTSDSSADRWFGPLSHRRTWWRYRVSHRRSPVDKIKIKHAVRKHVAQEMRRVVQILNIPPCGYVVKCVCVIVPSVGACRTGRHWEPSRWRRFTKSRSANRGQWASCQQVDASCRPSQVVKNCCCLCLCAASWWWGTTCSKWSPAPEPSTYRWFLISSQILISDPLTCPPAGWHLCSWVKAVSRLLQHHQHFRL